ncbi:MAG: hypothetical protein JWN48_4711, partial [Myxococcaceae bacterium]|nr:hypothetical protein [Myxococcaceae bacterium]
PERPYDATGLSNEQVLAPRPRGALASTPSELEGLVPLERLRRSPAA